MADYAGLDAAWLARLAHDAAERGNAASLGAIRAEIARRPAAEREACRREWIRQARGRERARNMAAGSPPQDWALVALELRRMARTGFGGGPPGSAAPANCPGTDDRGRAAGEPAGFDPLRLPESAAPGSLELHAPGKQRRWERWLCDHAGLTSLSVNLTRIVSGAQSPRHHRYPRRDEFLYVVSGEVVLRTGTGEEILRAGMCAGFPAGSRDGYWLLNRSGDDALLLVIGDGMPGGEAGDRRAQSRPGPNQARRLAPNDDNTPA
jgi:uncharacterized cupin superfamily protein